MPQLVKSYPDRASLAAIVDFLTDGEKLPIMNNAKI
jgi:hypothetical protein